MNFRSKLSCILIVYYIEHQLTLKQTGFNRLFEIRTIKCQKHENHYLSAKNELNFYSTSCDICKQYWFRFKFSYRLQCSQLYRAFVESVKNKSSPIESYQSRMRYFLSLSCSQDPTVSQTELLTKQVPPPSYLTLWVQRKRCQKIWQVKWDIFIRSSTPSQTGAKVSRGSLPPVQTSPIKMKPACPLPELPDSELHFHLISPADYMETSKLQNQS